jgi:hypothetical protein
MICRDDAGFVSSRKGVALSSHELRTLFQWQR